MVLHSLGPSPDLRAAFDDAVERLQRDEQEREEEGPTTTKLYQDAIWGRLPARLRRSLSRREFDRHFSVLQMEREDHAIEIVNWQLREWGVIE